MARPLRIEFKGALYLPRGNERRNKFFGDDDYQVFLGVLEEYSTVSRSANMVQLEIF